jgi:hypothetical protein
MSLLEKLGLTGKAKPKVDHAQNRASRRKYLKATGLKLQPKQKPYVK